LAPHRWLNELVRGLMVAVGISQFLAKLAHNIARDFSESSESSRRLGGGEQCMGRPYLLSDSHKTPVFSQSIITMLISHNQLHYLLHINFIKENIGMRKKRTPQNRKRITRDVQEARAKTNAKTEILQSIMPNILCK